MNKIKPSIWQNRIFGHILAFVIFLALGYGFYFASTHMKYTWKWTGVVDYFVYDDTINITSPIDGVVSFQNGQVIIEGLNQKNSVAIPNDYKVSINDQDTVFVGDNLASKHVKKPGPLLLGLWVTIKVSIVATILAFVIGAFLAFMKMSSYQFLKDIATVYITVVRGTPLLVQIFLFYFIIANIFGLDRFLAGTLSLGIFCAAYIAEVLRGAIESIDKGQHEASVSLGMNRTQEMTLIILPQALKRSLPALVGEVIALIKDSSLVSVISITDLTKAGREIVSNTFAPFETWIIVAGMYFSITFMLSLLGHYIEKRLKKSGQGM